MQALVQGTTRQIASVTGRHLLLIIGIAAIGLSAMTGAKAAWLFTKAQLAQHLLDEAWQRSLSENTPGKPWRWADIHTVGRLEIPDIDQSLVVLSDASGEAMAFGPGLVEGNLDTLHTSTIAIGGHRDTHLAFVEHLPTGAQLRLQTTSGAWATYQVADKQIVDSRTQQLHIASNNAGLVLITCYPFHAQQTGGPLRMVVRATPVQDAVAR